MKNMKRLIALGISATMVLGSSMVAFAAETTSTGTGNSTGTGSTEGLVDTEIYSVTLPTVGGGTYNFYLDPDNNIAETNGEKYSGFTPSGTTLGYFKTSGSTMSEKSAVATVTNDSYQDIDVTIEVAITGNDNIDIVEKTGINDAENPAMYMQLASTVKEDGQSDVDGTADVVDGNLTKTFTLSSDAVDYEKKYDSGESKYVMKKKDSEAHVATALDFELEVGCNSADDVDWTGATSDTPSVEVTWSYAKHVDAPVVPAGPSATLNSAGQFTITGLTAEKNITGYSDEITIQATTGADNQVYPLGEGQVTFNVDGWSAESGGTAIVSIGDAQKSYFAGQTVEMTYKLSDGTVVRASATLD